MTAFETPLMKAEFDRVASRSPMDTLSMKRYELPTPPAAKMSDVAAWNECVENSMAQKLTGAINTWCSRYSFSTNKQHKLLIFNTCSNYITIYFISRKRGWYRMNSVSSFIK